MKSFGRIKGTTLVEVVIAIAIIGTASVTLIGLLSSMAKRSADAMVSTEANAIAAAYLHEILGKPIVDPDGIDGTEAREAFDNVDDYLRLPDNVVRDLRGNAVANLAGYQVAVRINQIGVNGVPAAQSRRVDVTVVTPTGTQVQVRGFRS